MRFYPAGQSWLETPASGMVPGHFPRIGKTFWALATLLLLAGVAGSLFIFSHSASATPSPPAQATAKANDSTEKQDSRSQFRRLMVAGNDALARQQFPDAISAYKEAQRLFPEDVDAARGLAAARAARSDQENVPPPDPVMTEAATNVQVAQKAIVDQQGNRSDFMRLMNQASVAMLDGRYDDARTFYLQALQLATDPAASPVLALSTGNPFAPPVIRTQGGKTEMGPPWLLREIQLRGPGDYMIVTPTFPLLELKALPAFKHLFQTRLGLGEYQGHPLRKFTFNDTGKKSCFGDETDKSKDTIICFGHASDPESLESATAKGTLPFG